jgi:hypothetical protein
MNMLFKQLTCVGISQEREAGELVQYLFLVILLGCVTLRLRVLGTQLKKTQDQTKARLDLPLPSVLFFSFMGSTSIVIGSTHSPP